jgi:hypothetical protein
VPAAVVAAVVLVSQCLLFVSTAIVNRIIKLIVHNDVWYLPQNPEFEYGCLINIRRSIMFFLQYHYLIQLLPRLAED